MTSRDVVGLEHDDVEPGDLDDDLPPLIEEKPLQTRAPVAPVVASPTVLKTSVAPSTAAGVDNVANATGFTNECDARPSGLEDQLDGAALQATAALRAAAKLEEAKHRSDAAATSPIHAIRQVMAEADEPRAAALAEFSDASKRMIQAIAKDDFEDCEAAIMQGADITVDVGGGMRVLHMAAMRGEMFLTELLLSHKASINQRDLSGNTPLLYACHFYRQHGRCVEMTAQLLYHRADPCFTVREGGMAGTSALDIAQKACREPQIDESAPRQMLAMIKLAMEGREECFEAIAKVWLDVKSKHKKLYQVSGQGDNFGYALKNRDWLLPAGALNVETGAPVRLEKEASSILEEKFVDLKNYTFSDEGDQVKLYVTLEAASVPADAEVTMNVDFEYEAVDLKLRTPYTSYRLRIEPLFGSIDAQKCKQRWSAASRKATLTLAKRHTNRAWMAVQKNR
eukprot:TRINITY_DN31065_c0_g1_i1.p1 TRINITY_DN31065_c0_g1~~TRINITY_DN31065_c0_g1_i1.p1  ORF type:complete len:454 (+),score=91.62 TRINITY_DN31065_c0_g1_i1:50-1411(+)